MDKKIDANLKQIKKHLLNISIEHPDLSKELNKWILEMTIKTSIIKSNPTKEKVKRVRGRIYWVDFGVNIGSEFNYPHFCVVIKEFNNTVIGVPISSKKEDDSEWKCDDNLIVDIGCLEDLPDEKVPCYAMVNQIRTLSKQRLSDYKHNGKHIKMKLNSKQLGLIDDAIKKLCKN